MKDEMIWNSNTDAARVHHHKRSVGACGWLDDSEWPGPEVCGESIETFGFGWTQNDN
jgi:hypothetical protein